jgi:glucosamine--fructose-6-phosphate aminotransferase (isomerizing)
MQPSYDTLKEIQTQPDAWEEAVQVAIRQAGQVEQLWRSGGFDQVIFTGCGSTYYLSLAGASLFQQLTGFPARAVPGGELLFYPANTYSQSGETFLVAVSRSGNTSETIQAVKAFRQEKRGRALVITNYPHSPLAELGDLTLGLPEGQEKSVAQTRSFACMCVAATAISAILGGRQDLLGMMQRLPESGRRLLADYDALAHAWGSDLSLDRFYFLGSGPRYGLACEVNLKMKEMTLTHSEAFHFMEFRHGPMSMVTATAAVIGLLSDSNRAHEQAVLQEMSALGGRLLSLGESGVDVAFESHLPEEIRGVLYLPVIQMIAYQRSVAKGLNPDRPKNLSAVVKLEL